jgi:hypothetical protein
MLWSDARDKITFTSLHRKVLADIPIDPQTHPILRDFPALLDFVRRERPALTKGGQLPMAVLEPINGLLSRPIEHGLQRPSQKSFPHINGLYLLLRASGLTLVAGGKKPVLSIDEDLAAVWENLNPTEQYMNLLETWFLRAKPEIIDPQGSFSYRSNREWLELIMLAGQIPQAGLPVTKENDLRDRLNYLPGLHNVALAELFNIFRVEDEPPQTGQGWLIASLHLTPFGRALVALLGEEMFVRHRKMVAHMLIRDENIPPGALQPILQPHFPDWRRNLVLPEQSLRPGVYQFKVSLGRIWRRIVASAKMDLDSLARAIVYSVDFDNDHLHCFTYRNRQGLFEQINHPFMDEGPRTNDFLIGDLPLAVGQSMTFIFDFGDHWEFEVTLEKVDENGKMAETEPTVVEAHGEPPAQYPSWVDEDDDWD